MKWLIKNTKLIKRLLLLVFVTVAFALAFNDVKVIYMFLICFCIYAIPVLIISFLPRIYFQNVIKRFEETCNPEEYVEYLTLYYKSYPKLPLNQANYAVALMLDRSKLREARMIMETLDMNKIYGNALNFILYNNLCTLYIDLNELDKAESAYIKALEYDASIKNEAQRLRNKHYIASLACDLAIKKNDPEKALSYIPNMKNETLLDKSRNALFLGKIYLLQNETEKAKEQLEFVIKNAPKINSGQEAKELLEKIEQ